MRSSRGPISHPSSRRADLSLWNTYSVSWRIFLGRAGRRRHEGGGERSLIAQFLVRPTCTLIGGLANQSHSSRIAVGQAGPSVGGSVACRHMAGRCSASLRNRAEWAGKDRPGRLLAFSVLCLFRLSLFDFQMIPSQTLPVCARATTYCLLGDDDNGIMLCIL